MLKVFEKCDNITLRLSCTDTPYGNADTEKQCNDLPNQIFAKADNFSADATSVAGCYCNIHGIGGERIKIGDGKISIGSIVRKVFVHRTLLANADMTFQKFHRGFL